ncbi:MAG: TIGR02391 family protein, partial [Sciscionella sp.]
ATDSQYKTTSTAVLNGAGAFIAFGAIGFSVAKVIRLAIHVTKSSATGSRRHEHEHGQQSKHTPSTPKLDIEVNSYDYLTLEDLHPWVASSARDLWRSHHYRDAVEQVARTINDKTQKKVWSYRSETTLMEYVFGFDKPPTSSDGKKLRFHGDPKSTTWKNRMNAARHLGGACYQGLRNVAAHEDSVDWTREMTLQYLAMFSVLAHWIDECDAYGQ